MARLFDVVRELSGQSAAISIPRPYIKFCEGNHTHAAVLSQLVFWSSTKASGEWFYKANDELADELCLSVDQVRYAIRQLKQRLGEVIQTRVKKANGVPTSHYMIDGDRLVELLFPDNLQDSQIDSVNLPNPNGNITESKRENYQTHGSGNITESINRSKPYTNTQILNVPSELETESVEPVLFEIPLRGKTKTHSVTKSQLSELAELYPAVDVAQQIRNMIGWCKANPTRQKTSSGVAKFIHAWLCKEQDKGYSARRPSPVSPHKDKRKSVLGKIRELEIQIDSQGIALNDFRNRKGPVSEQAAEACQRKINQLLADRQALYSELRGLDGE
ncbi:ATPase [Vibrio vulnificus]|nr:ATPase [Vibrio vulnificus]